MNITIGKSVTVLTAVVLVTVVAMATATPAFAGKPEGKGKPKTPPDFQVETDVTHYSNYWDQYQEGAFVSTGMIDDAGPAVEDSLDDVFLLTLSGGAGEIDVLIHVKQSTVKTTKTGDTIRKYRGSFEVVGGTGAYADLEASGSATGEAETTIDNIGVWSIQTTRRWQLDGFVTSW